MATLKKFLKYILMIVGMYILTSVLVFIGFNANYKEIKLKGEIPSQISVERAEANKQETRIYGHVKNSEENNINEKYIKISVYNDSAELLSTEYLKIIDAPYNEQKLFRAKISANNAKIYEISIVDNEQN